MKEITIENPQTINRMKLFFNEAVRIVGENNLKSNDYELEAIQNNSIGLERNIKGWIQPRSKMQVIEIVKLAYELDIKLHTISTGKNLGYGSKLPPGENQVVLELSKLNEIENYDKKFDWICIQPGVTQQQMYKYLQNSGDLHLMDTTGAGLDTSFMGNALEGGFGHSPFGNRRKQIFDLEVLLPTGQIFKTGGHPDIGPGLSELFVQSNFGIVLSMKVQLYKKPERIETFILQLKDRDHLGELFQKLSYLKSIGVLQSNLHMANAARTFVSTTKLDESKIKEGIYTEEEMLKNIESPFVKAFSWSGVGGLFGTKEQVKLYKKIIKRELKSIASIKFFDDSKFRNINFVIKRLLPLSKETKEDLLEKIDSLKDFHEMQKGVPTDRPTHGIGWKYNNPQKLGLLWSGYIVPCDEELIKKYVKKTDELFAKHNFECPLTLTIINNNKLICVNSIHFDKSDKEHMLEAKKLHKEFEQLSNDLGIFPYRKSAEAQSSCTMKDNKAFALKLIKLAMDPKGILSPGKYGIGNK